MDKPRMQPEHSTQLKVPVFGNALLDMMPVKNTLRHRPGPPNTDQVGEDIAALCYENGGFQCVLMANYDRITETYPNLRTRKFLTRLKQKISCYDIDVDLRYVDYDDVSGVKFLLLCTMSEPRVDPTKHITQDQSLNCRTFNIPLVRHNDVLLELTDESGNYDLRKIIGKVSHVAVAKDLVAYCYDVSKFICLFVGDFDKLASPQSYQDAYQFMQSVEEWIVLWYGIQTELRCIDRDPDYDRDLGDRFVLEAARKNPSRSQPTGPRHMNVNVSSTTNYLEFFEI